MSLTIDNFDEKIDLVIGDLLSQADEISKSIITAFDPAKDILVNKDTLGGPRFSAPALNTCAEFLHISTINEDGSKIYSNKPSLALRIILEIQSFYPTFCAECAEEYSITFNSEEPQVLRCFLCYQGAHNCETVTKKIPNSDTVLPAGSVWFCKSCFELNDPSKSKKTKSKKVNASISMTRSGRGTPDTDQTPQSSQDIETDQIPQSSQNIEQNAEQNSSISNVNSENPSPAVAPPDICELFKVGKCPHGLSGKKIHNSSKCDKLHPKRCRRFMRNGSAKKYGCKHGEKCSRYHPKHCPSSLYNRTCFDSNCTMVHLAGTKRRPNSTDAGSNQARNRSQRAPPHDRKSNDYNNNRDNTNRQRYDSYRRDESSHTRSQQSQSQSTVPQKNQPRASPENNSAFLEIRDLLKTFQESVQKEISQMKDNITSQEDRLAKLFQPPQLPIFCPGFQQPPQVPLQMPLQTPSTSPLNFHQFPAPCY